MYVSTYSKLVLAISWAMLGWVMQYFEYAGWRATYSNKENDPLLHSTCIHIYCPSNTKQKNPIPVTSYSIRCLGKTFVLSGLLLLVCSSRPYSLIVAQDKYIAAHSRTLNSGSKSACLVSLSTFTLWISSEIWHWNFLPLLASAQ